MIVTIQGSSDDVVDVSWGDVEEGGFEFYGTDLYVELSTGHVFYVKYTNRGIWRISQVAGPVVGVTTRICNPAPDMDEDEDGNYSDVASVEVSEPPTAMSWASWPPSKSELIEAVEEVAPDYFETLSEEELRRILFKHLSG